MVVVAENGNEIGHKPFPFLVNRLSVLLHLQVEHFQKRGVGIFFLEQAVALLHRFGVGQEMLQIGTVELRNHIVQKLTPQFATPVNQFLILGAYHDEGNAAYVLGHARTILLVEF